MPIASIKPKIIGVVLHGGRIQFFLSGTYNALVGKASRPLINPVFAQLKAVLLVIVCSTTSTAKTSRPTTKATINTEIGSVHFQIGPHT